jgi:hypothetical protein
MVNFGRGFTTLEAERNARIEECCRLYLAGFVDVALHQGSGLEINIGRNIYDVSPHH